MASALYPVFQSSLLIRIKGAKRACDRLVFSRIVLTVSSRSSRQTCGQPIRSCYHIPQLARYGVINRFEMLIYSRVNCVFSSIYALSRIQLRNFKTAS
jgi:hypothetical protein